MKERAGEIRALLASSIEAAAPRLTSVHEDIWLRVGMEQLDLQRRAGWKIHLSTTPFHYEALLQCALPILLEAGFPLKCADTSDTVEKLNSGELGLPQVGKAVTVYVGSPEPLSALGGRLVEALRGLPGPRIVHDSRFAEDAPVYARFGPFDGAYRVDATGRARRILLHPEQGEIIDPTDGGPVCYPEAPGIPPYEAYDHLAFIRDRFIIVRMLHLSAKGGVFLAMDRKAPEAGLQLLKTARAWTNSDHFGRDARWALRREQAWLERLAGLPGVPPAGILLEGEEVTVLCRPYLEGETYWERWTRPDARTEAAQARLHQALDVLERQVAAIHDAGCVVRDLSPGNILMGDDDAVWILDFELAEEPGTHDAPYRRGTKGFYDEGRDRLSPAAVADDDYALSRLRSMVFGASAQHWLDGENERNKPEKHTNKYKTIHVVKSEAGLNSECQPAVGQEREVAFHAVIKHYQTASTKKVWGADAHTVYDGSAGLYLFLSEYAGSGPGASAELDTIADTHTWRQLLETLQHLPGAHFGASGLALALCHYGARNDEALLRAGHDGMLTLSRTSSPIPDLCQGVAGLGLAAWAARSVLAQEDLKTILDQVGAQLQTLAVEAEDGIWWPWPEGAAYGGFSGQAYLGFAHGLAGILWLASTVKVSLAHQLLPPAMVEQGFATLLRHGRSLPDGAVWWPVSRSDDTCWNAWCHGTPGVVKALAAGHAVGLVERNALRAALQGMGAANSGELCLCHGLASRLDAYADAFAACPDLRSDELIASAAAADRQLLAEALQQFFVGKSLMEPGKGFMTGLAGMVRTLIRYDVGIDGVYEKLLP